MQQRNNYNRAYSACLEHTPTYPQLLQEEGLLNALCQIRTYRPPAARQRSIIFCISHMQIANCHSPTPLYLCRYSRAEP
jgi:hypothetical protein